MQPKKIGNKNVEEFVNQSRELVKNSKKKEKKIQKDKYSDNEVNAKSKKK